MEQATNNILMIRPANFNYNDQTASNNYYQKKGGVFKMGPLKNSFFK